MKCICVVLDCNKNEMRTRARLVIKRRKSDIYLRVERDGFIDAFGRDVWYSVSDLINEFSYEQLIKLVEGITMLDDSEFSDMEREYGFDGLDLVKLVKGDTHWFNNYCDDINYEYILDVYEKSLRVNKVNEEKYISLTFDEIKKGVKLHKIVFN